MATNDDIIKLLRKETVYKLVSDESDTPASSPESLLPKEPSDLIPSATTSTTTSATTSTSQQSDISSVTDVMRYSETLGKHSDVDSSKLDDVPVAVPTRISAGHHMMGVRAVSPVTQRISPTPGGRPASTGFMQQGQYTRIPMSHCEIDIYFSWKIKADSTSLGYHVRKDDSRPHIL